MTYTDSTNKTDKKNTAKSNTHNNQTQNAKTESYSNLLMNSMEYSAVFGFLLAGMAYELTHEKQMSD